MLRSTYALVQMTAAPVLRLSQVDLLLVPRLDCDSWRVTDLVTVGHPGLRQ